MKMNFSAFLITLLFTTFAGWGFVDSKCIVKKTKFDLINYGVKVKVNGKNMVVDIVGEENETTLVLLTAFGVVSPVFFYKPFTEALSDKFKVVTVEPFGYGISDLTKDERTVENIVSELHQALHKLGIDKFYLMAHSIGGIYSLSYANEYPEDVLGFIGIDISTPGIEELKDNKETVAMIREENENLKRISEEELTEMIKSDLDPTYNYSKKDFKYLGLIYKNRYSNDVMLNEAENIPRNTEAVEDLVFPKSVPTLQFISSINCGNLPQWKLAHEAIASNSTRSDLFISEGSHMLNIDQKDDIVKKIKDWIN